MALTDPRLPRHDDLAPDTAPSLLERTMQQLQLTLAADERRARETRSLRLERTKHRRRITETFELQGAVLRELEPAPARPLRWRIAQHVIGNRGHQSRSTVHRRAERCELTPSRAADDAEQCVACGDPDRCRESQADRKSVV